MKKMIIAASAFLLTLALASWCLAGPPIPNLVGAWEVKSEGGVMVRGESAGESDPLGGKTNLS